MTTSIAAVPWTGPPPWAVGAARRPAPAREAVAARTLRVPLLSAEDWIWELVGVDEMAEPAPRVATDDRHAWWIVAAPAAVVLQVAVTDVLRLVVPRWALVLELLATGWMLAHADANRLRRKGIDAPSLLLALAPPLYLFQRAGLTRDPRLPLGWLGVAAVTALALVVVDGRLSAVPLRSQAVENVLYEQLFEGQLPLDAHTGNIRCPTFSKRWVGQEFTCTGTDAHRTVPLEVSVLDHDGALNWQPLRAAP